MDTKLWDSLGGSALLEITARYKRWGAGRFTRKKYQEWSKYPFSLPERLPLRLVNFFELIIDITR